MRVWGFRHQISKAKYLKMSVAHIGKLQENTTTLYTERKTLRHQAPDVRYPEKVERWPDRISEKVEHRKGDRLRVQGVGTPPPDDTERVSLSGATPSGFPKKTHGALPYSEQLHSDSPRRRAACSPIQSNSIREKYKALVNITPRMIAYLIRICCPDHRLKEWGAAVQLSLRHVHSKKKAFTIKKPPRKARKCMCGGDDHLARKHPVSLEACGGLRTAGGQLALQAVPFTLHSQTEVAPPPVTLPIPTSEEPYTRMDRLDQRLRQMRASDRVITWEDFDGALVANLPAKFRMLEIERYTSIGYPRIHLKLYSTVMRAHGLDEAHMVMFFPMSLSSAAQYWFASLDVSRRRTWDDITQEFLRQFAFNTIIGVSRRDLEAREALYGIEEGIARGLWHESSPTDSKGKKPSGRQRSGDVGAISSAGMRPPRHYQTIGQTFGFYYPPSPYVQYRPASPFRSMTPTYLHLVSQPVFAAHRPPRQFAQLGMPLSRAFQKLIEGGLLTPLAPKPVPPRFRLDLHCSYHQGPGHDTDHYNALRHDIQDLIDQGLVNLGQPSVTTNPLPAHSTHASPSPPRDIHHMDLIEDDSIHMLSWDDGLPEPIVLHDSYEIDGVSLGHQAPTPFSLIPDEASFQLTHSTPLVI
uniref:Retrotransposon gag domain-containing protein n=1 Tax=Vitis vinifera TaxID=29760 RepID=A5B3T5_VITVI|nr:hypothetical protein VITISV_031688 [Vitis vinifera]